MNAMNQPSAIIVRGTHGQPACVFNIVKECRDQLHGSMEVFVDDPVPAMDDYNRLMRQIFSRYPKSWVRVHACAGHLQEMIQKAVEFMDNPDLWNPHIDNPPILTANTKKKPEKAEDGLRLHSSRN